MKVGLIPPLGLEKWALKSDFHLMLATPACMNNGEYCRTYRTAKIERNDFIVMDNGANEGCRIDMSDYISVCAKFGVNEVVLPDVIGNRDRTVSAVEKFFTSSPWRAMNPTPGFMYVAHGPTLRQVLNPVKDFADNCKAITTIGLPRSLLAEISLHARIDLANAIWDRLGDRFAVHLLGTSPLWPAEVKFASKYAGHIRSVDTSLVFNFTLEGERLAGSTRHIARPPTYFSRVHTVDERLLEENIETLRKWAVHE